MPSSQPKALVTGGCGFVGRHYVKWLLEHDYHVTVVDDLSTGLYPECWPTHLQVPKAREQQFTFLKGDLRDYARTVSSPFRLILHLAAVVGGRMTIDGDPLRVATDLAIDASFFNWVVKLNPLPDKVMYFSSSAAYPISEQTPEHHRPLSEDMIGFTGAIGVPDMTYGWSKLTGEFLAGFAAQSYGLNVAIYRPFSGYGEDQDFTYPFPSIIRRAARRESPLVVWGSGRQLRDFIYIDDAVEATFASAPHLQPGEALNLGTGRGTSFRDLAETACSVIGHRTEVVNDASKPEGVFARVADCERMFRYYRPRVSLERGIEISYRFQQEADLVSAR